MQTGTKVSLAGHGALILVALFGLPSFGPDEEREPIRVTDVSFVSEAEFDAAQAAETIGNDMTAQGESAEFARRCLELARQMRTFAGHTASGQTFDDFTAGQSKSTGLGTALVRVFRRAKPW